MADNASIVPFLSVQSALGDDITATPNYEQIKNGMYSSSWRAAGWGALATAMVLGGGLLCTTGMGAIIGIPLIATSLFPGYKAYKATIDQNAGYAEIGAQRTAQLLAAELAKQPSNNPALQAAIAAESQKNWQQAMADRAAAQAMQQTAKG